MSTLIIVIGTTDLQLDSDKTSREKGRTEKERSDKVWRYWYNDIKPDCYDISFLPKTAFPDIAEPYRIPSRVLGTVYQESSAEVQEEILSYLTSDLAPFCQGYDKIIAILTDQSSVYTEEEEVRRPSCPYWDDTVMCRPILEKLIGETLFLVKDSQQPLDTIQGVQEYLDTLDLPEDEDSDITIRVPSQNLFSCALALKYGANAKYI